MKVHMNIHHKNIHHINIRYISVTHESTLKLDLSQQR